MTNAPFPRGLRFTGNRLSDGPLLPAIHTSPDGNVALYRSPDGWTVSVNQVWVPGIYADKETALRAAFLTDDLLLALTPIWRVDGENRPATAADLDAVEGRR